MGTIRDPTATRARIIAAALAEFGEHGIAGARVDRIARAARINKRMLYHYFGDKAQLYAAVLESALANRASDVPQAGLGERLDGLQRESATNPARVRLLMWEALAVGRGAIVGEQQRTDEWRARVDRLECEQRAGRLSIECDPAQLELSLLALAWFPVAFPQLTRLITGSAPDDPAFLAARRAFFDALTRRLIVDNGEGTGATDARTPVSKPRYRLTAKVT